MPQGKGRPYTKSDKTEFMKKLRKEELKRGLDIKGMQFRDRLSGRDNPVRVKTDSEGNLSVVNKNKDKQKEIFTAIREEEMVKARKATRAKHLLPETVGKYVGSLAGKKKK